MNRGQEEDWAEGDFRKSQAERAEALCVRGLERRHWDCLGQEELRDRAVATNTEALVVGQALRHCPGHKEVKK
jgi:hypothetical protein